MSSNPQPLEEVCPSCGSFVDALNEETGFCIECTGPSSQPLLTSIPKIERWLIKYADDVEEAMETYYITSRLAVGLVYHEYKAICVVCNEVISRGTYGRHFICNAKPECRKTRRRYKYYLHEKGLSKQEALRLALKQAGGHE